MKIHKWHSGIVKHIGRHGSGIVRHFGSHANTRMKYSSGIFRPIGRHANTMQRQMKIHKIPFMNRQINWKPCKYHAELGEYTWNIIQESSDLLKVMQILRRAMSKHVRYKSGIVGSIGRYANTTPSHMKTHKDTTQESSGLLKVMQIARKATCKTHAKLVRNLQTAWESCKCHAEPPENMWNSVQESSDLLEAMQIPRRATWKHMKYQSGIFRPLGSHANTTQSHMKTQEMLLMQIPRRATWTYEISS